MVLIQSEKDRLLKKIQVVSNITERKSTMPLLANLLIKKNGEKIEFLSSDVEMQITTSDNIGVGVQEIETTVSARKILDVLRLLPDNTSAEILYDQSKIFIKAGRTKFSLQTIGSESYPLMVEPSQWVASIQIEQKTLKNLLSMVHFAMAQQDLRYFLNGVLLVIKGTELASVCADGHRIATANAKATSNLGDHEVILPRKAVLELLRLLSEDDSLVTIDLSKNQARFKFNDIELKTKLVEGKFPDFRRLLPKEHNVNFTLPKDELHRSLQRVSLVTSEKFRGIRCIVEKNRITFLASNSNSEEVRDEMDIEYDADVQELGFNVNYLIDIINHVKSDKFGIIITPGNGGVAIKRYLADGSQDPDFIYFIMMMRV